MVPTNPPLDRPAGAAWGSFVGDALAMPVHWYYDRAALRRDYGEVRDYLAPRNPHGDSILWRSEYTPLNERGWGYGNTLPDRITLFQHSIEDDCADDEEEIIVAIGETLIHELGHYFGMTEDEIMAIEERYWRGEPDPNDLEEVGADAPLPPEPREPNE